MLKGLLMDTQPARSCMLPSDIFHQIAVVLIQFKTVWSFSIPSLGEIVTKVVCDCLVCWTTWEFQ